MIRTTLAIALLVGPALGQDAPCTPDHRCTVIAAAPADPVAAQCMSDRARLLDYNGKQAALIDDLTARVKGLEAPKHKAVKKHRRQRHG